MGSVICRLLRMMWKYLLVGLLSAGASLFQGTSCVPLAMSSRSASSPFCTPGASECYVKATPAGEIWVPRLLPKAGRQGPFTAPGFDSTTPCPSTNLYGTTTDPQLIENQVQLSLPPGYLTHLLKTCKAMTPRKMSPRHLKGKGLYIYRRLG